MTNVIPMFDFNGVRLRGTVIDDQPWFVAADACRCVSLDLSAGTHQHLLKLDPDERRPVPPNTFCGKGMNQATLVSEAGLYKLIQRSNKPEAKAFDRWVRHEVLPSIRRTGGYVMRGLAHLFLICSHWPMERIDPSIIAEAILTAAGWARVGITAPASHIRIAAAHELARTILEEMGQEAEGTGGDQLGLSLS